MSTFGANDQYAREHRRQVIEMTKTKIAQDAITGPVRLEFNRLKTDDTFDGITPKANNIWLVDENPNAKRKTGKRVVERMDDGSWECSHKGWKPGDQCVHISRVRHMLGDDAVVPYDGRRRRPLTKWLYGQQTEDKRKAEDTKRNAARVAEPKKVPELAMQLCKRFAPQPPRNETKSKDGGATGVLLSVRVFALLMKVFWSVNYEHLRARLEENGLIWTVEGYERSAPGKTSFCRWFGDPKLTAILERIFEQTTKPAVRLDTMVVGDSHDIPTTVLTNSRDEKYGNGRSKYRPDRPLVRQHFVVGKVSNVIMAADTTLTVGIGSGDGPHLPGMLRKAKRLNSNISEAAFDKAYSSKRNFAASEALGMRLFVREQTSENRMSKGWPQQAQEMSRLEHEQPKDFAEAYRFRSKAEGTPSRIKARNPCVRLRRRKTDPNPSLPAGVSEKSSLSELDEELVSAVLDVATQRVGVARLNESLAIMIVANLRALNVLAHLLGQTLTFETDMTFNPPTELSENDLYDEVA